MCLVTGTQTPMAGPLVSQGFREMNGCDKDTVAMDPKEGSGPGLTAAGGLQRDDPGQREFHEGCDGANIEFLGLPQ